MKARTSLDEPWCTRVLWRVSALAALALVVGATDGCLLFVSLDACTSDGMCADGTCVEGTCVPAADDDAGFVSRDAGHTAHDAGTHDAGGPPDAGPPADGGGDGGTFADAGADDAGLVDAGAADAGVPVDAGQEDAGPVDAGDPVDGGADAGIDAGVDAGQAQDAGVVVDAGPDDDEDGDGFPDLVDNCPSVANAGQDDDDGDGVGLACDCDDNEEDEMRVIVFAGNLDVDPNTMIPLLPSSSADDDNWAFTAEGLVQSAHADESMNLFAETALSLTRPRITVDAVSTSFPEVFDDNRQILIHLVDVSSPNRAIGCGIELVRTGVAPFSPFTSAVEWSMVSQVPTTTALARIDRPAVLVDELFRMELDLTDQGALDCHSWVQNMTAHTTVSYAGPTLPTTISFGLATRETRARFTNLRVCDEAIPLP